MATRSSTRKQPVRPLESLEGRELLSTSTDPLGFTGRTRPTAQVGGSTSQSPAINRLRGTISGTTSGVPGLVTLNPSEGRAQGLGDVKFQGQFWFQPATGSFQITGPRNATAVLDVTNVTYRNSTSNGMLGRMYVYNFTIDTRVSSTTLADAPETARLSITARYLQVGENDYRGTYRLNFRPPASNS